MRHGEGWWAARGWPSSSTPSKSGNSVTHRNRRAPSPTGGRPRSRRSCAEHLARRAPLVGHHQHEVAGRRRRCAATSPARSASERNLVERRVERRRRSLGGHPEPGQALGARAPWPARPGASSRLRPERRPPSGTTIAFTHGRGEGPHLGAGEDLGQVDELHPEPQVGLVDAEAVHGLVPRHPLDVAGGRSPIAASVASSDGLGHDAVDVVLGRRTTPRCRAG